MATPLAASSDLAFLALLARAGELPRTGTVRRDRKAFVPEPDAIERSEGFNRLADALQSADAARAAIAGAVAELAVAVLDRQPGLRRTRGAGGPPRRTLLVGDTLLVLDPDVSFDQSAIVEGALMPEELIEQAMIQRRLAPSDDPVTAMLDPGTIAAALPTVVRTRLPWMTPLCVPRPCIEIACGDQTSTAGIICRDAAGRLGVTACFHGTGPIGTKVQVGLREATVSAVHIVQDIVFIALDDAFNLPELIGHAGIDATRAPAQGMRARFEGAKSGPTDTWISSHDVGLLRRRASVQLKVQTGPDTNFGDSGSALIDEDDRVIGFAFERTAYGERPEFTDWIWAANALAALGLVPIATQGGI